MALATHATAIAPLEIAKITISTLVMTIAPLTVAISSFAMKIATLQ